MGRPVLLALTNDFTRLISMNCQANAAKGMASVSVVSQRFGIVEVRDAEKALFFGSLRGASSILHPLLFLFLGRALPPEVGRWLSGGLELASSPSCLPAATKKTTMG